MRFIILHYHFLKNAGMSVESILHRSFGERFRSVDSPERDGHIGEAELLDYLRANPSIEAVSSHQIRYPMPRAAGFLFFDVCFLREPLARIRSMYHYFREKPAPGDPVSDFANALALGEFVGKLVEEMPWYVHDAQVNLLANGIANDIPAPGDFDRAAAKMLRTSFLGVVDRFQESLAAGEHFLRPVFPTLDCAAEMENVSARQGGELRELCEPALYAEVIRITAGDAKLVEMARAEVGRRFRLAQAAR